jgi:hypothetical protein
LFSFCMQSNMLSKLHNGLFSFCMQSSMLSKLHNGLFSFILCIFVLYHYFVLKD